MHVGWILGSRPSQLELRTEAQSLSTVNCNVYIPGKNHSERVVIRDGGSRGARSLAIPKHSGYPST